MHPPFQVQRRVEFCETDAAGIAHFTAFFQYMEQAEHAFLRHLGLSVMFHDDEGPLGWPRASATCNYKGAVKFEDVLDIAVAVERLGEKSVSYVMELTLNGNPVATGHLTAVCCRLPPGQPPRSVRIPDWIAERLRTYVSTSP